MKMHRGSGSLSKGIVYYTDNRLDEKIADAVRRQLLKIGLPIISVSLKPIDFGRNIVLPLGRGDLTMFRQILTGLVCSDSDIVFLCEHDNLYHPSHFEFTPEDDRAYYNTNAWNIYCGNGGWKGWNPDGRKCLYHNSKRVSQLCAKRTVLVNHYTEKVNLVMRDGFSYRTISYEPGCRAGELSRIGTVDRVSAFPNIDIKHGKNRTMIRWDKSQFRNKKYTEPWIESTIDRLEGWDTSLLERLVA
jgi:hypothetical protein